MKPEKTIKRYSIKHEALLTKLGLTEDEIHFLMNDNINKRIIIEANYSHAKKRDK